MHFGVFLIWPQIHSSADHFSKKSALSPAQAVNYAYFTGLQGIFVS